MKSPRQLVASLRSLSISKSQVEQDSPSYPIAELKLPTESFRSSKWFIQLVVGMAVFTDIFLYAIIVPVMPFALDRRIGVPEATIQNTVSILIAVYGGALALASPICGWASDQSPNRKAPLLAGLIAISGATVLLHLGPNVGILILARILQGISAAVVWVVGLALLADSIPKEELGSAMGMVFVAMSLGVLVGPLFGGFVFEKAGYNAVFAMAYAVLALDLILRFMMIERKQLVHPVVQEPETISAATITEMISSEPEQPERLKVNLENEKEISISTGSGSSSERVILSRGASFKNFFTRSPPVTKLPKEKPAIVVLLSSWRLVSCLYLISIAAILGSQFDSVLPLYVKNTFHWDSTAAGLIFLNITLTAFLSPIFGWGVDRWGPRWFAVAGFLYFAPFQILLRLVRENTIKDKVLLCFFLAMIGIAFDLMTPTLLVEITAIVEDKEKRHPGIFGKNGAMAQAYGLFNFAWAMGSLIGPIWSGFVLQRTSWSTMTWTLALLSFVSALPCAIWTDGYYFDQSKRNKLQKRDLRKQEQQRQQQLQAEGESV